MPFEPDIEQVGFRRAISLFVAFSSRPPETATPFEKPGFSPKSVSTLPRLELKNNTIAKWPYKVVAIGLTFGFMSLLKTVSARIIF